jgi:hypothetical protein
MQMKHEKSVISRHGITCGSGRRLYREERIKIERPKTIKSKDTISEVAISNVQNVKMLKCYLAFSPSGNIILSWALTHPLLKDLYFHEN